MAINESSLVILEADVPVIDTESFKKGFAYGVERIFPDAHLFDEYKEDDEVSSETAIGWLIDSLQGDLGSDGIVEGANVSVDPSFVYGAVIGAVKSLEGNVNV